MISIFINSLTSGGAEKVVLTLIKKFRQITSDLDLILIEKEQFYDLPKDVPSRYLTKYESLEKGILKFPYLIVCAIRLKKHVEANNIKIVQSHLLRATFINAIARMLGANHHAQIVLHSRINFDDKPWLYQVFAKWVYKKILFRADSVISICETMKNDLDEYLDLKSHPRHLAIYNPHNLQEIENKAKDEVSDFVFAKDKKYIISVGRLADGKRLDDLISAFSILQNQEIDLIFIGNGPLENKLKKLVKELHLEGRIHFLGYQSNPYKYLSRADVYVLSSEWEGLPNILIESMICGTPVISSDCISGPREIINPDSELSFSLKDEVERGPYGLLYPVGNIELLAQAINKLLKNEAMQNEFIQQGYIRAKRFDADEISKKYLDTFPLKTEDV